MISPELALKEILLFAFIPPKDLLKFSTSKILVIRIFFFQGFFLEKKKSAH